MQKRLTELTVERMTNHRSDRTEVSDLLMPGLVLRISASGKKSWSVIYRVAGSGLNGTRGKVRRMTLGQYPLIKLSEARDLARQVHRTADEGVDPAAKQKHERREKSERSFERVCESFIALHARRHTKKWRDTQALLQKHVVVKWSNRDVREIDRSDCVRLLDQVIMANGISVAREVRKQLTKLLNWSADRGYIKANPLAGARMPELRYTKRERVLSMDELRRIWTAADKLGCPFGIFTKLLILTAQRRGEIANMQGSWVQEIDGEAVLQIPGQERKSGRLHIVPLNENSHKLLSSIPTWGDGAYLLSTTNGMRPISGFSKTKKRLDALSGVEEWTFHDLRRSAATHMARLGVMQEHIERVLGHEVPGVAGTYNRYSYMREKRHALDAWASEICTSL